MRINAKMNLIEAVQQYTKCMAEPGPCQLKNCPLEKVIRIKLGDGGIEAQFEMQGCTLLGQLEILLEYPDAHTYLEWFTQREIEKLETGMLLSPECPDGPEHPRHGWPSAGASQGQR